MRTIEADLMVNLEGPFNGIDMDTFINPEMLPLSQPYNIAPWNYNGQESVSVIPNPDIVDWILLEFRDAANVQSATSTTTINQQAAFLLQDGSIVGIDGFSNVQFNGTISEQLYIVVKHRNHIDIISAYPLSEIGEVFSYDFTSSINQAYGGSNGYKTIAPGKFGMAGGDTDANGVVEIGDKIIWSFSSGASGYLMEDHNLDGEINNIDKNDIWILNDGIKSTQVPE